MAIDTEDLIKAAAVVLVGGINALPLASRLAVDDAIGEGGRVELRIGVCDGLTTVSLWMCNLDGQAVELARLG